MLEDFQIVKHALLTAPKLQYPDFTGSKPFHIACDASNVGIGAVLYQPNSYGGDITGDNIVNIISKKLSGTQVNYPAYKKELYAVVYALRKFHVYVWGQPDVVIFTDHKPLTYLLEQKELSPAVQQWLDVLLDYQFEIRYRAGKLNILPDHLSRLYVDEYKGKPWGVPNGWKLPESSSEGGVGIAAIGIDSYPESPNFFSPTDSSSQLLGKKMMLNHHHSQKLKSMLLKLNKKNVTSKSQLQKKNVLV